MKILYTKETTSPVYSDALKIRKQVFIEEQGVPENIEIDQYEDKCFHLVLYSDKNEAVATCRLLPLDNKILKLQRMAVEKAFRGKDYGRMLIIEAEKLAIELGYNTITLGAQVSALGFYEKLGYKKQGELFVEANIEHSQMDKSL